MTSPKPADHDTERIAEQVGPVSTDATVTAEEADDGTAETLIEDADDGTAESSIEANTKNSDGGSRGLPWRRLLAYVVLPGLAFVLALGAGYLKWQDSSVRESQQARIESMRAASDSTVALLSYRPDTVEKDLGAARDLLTGNFKDSYTSLIHDVVIPGSKQKRISAVASVPAAASVSASQNRAVVLVFVNQTVIIGNDPPTDTASSVRVTLDKIRGRWLIAEFDPV